MEFSRNERVAEEIKKAASDIINNDLKDPRIKGLISVTDVDLSKDLRYAKIFLSIYGEKHLAIRTFEVIKNAEGYIRKEIGKRVRLKFLPEIVFKEDNSIEYGAHIQNILNKIQKNEENDNKGIK